MHETAHTLVCAVCRGAVSQKRSPVNEWTELGVHSYYLMAIEVSCAASILPAEWASPLFWATVLLICSVLWSGEHEWFLTLIFQLSVLNCRKSKYPKLTSSVLPLGNPYCRAIVKHLRTSHFDAAPFSWYLHFYCPFLGDPLNDTESALVILSCTVWALGGPMPVFERTGLHLLQEIKHHAWSRTKS